MAIGSLHELDDWKLEDGEPDIVGWPVIENEGASRGTVVDLIIDTDAERVVEIVTDRGDRIAPEHVDIGEGVVTLVNTSGPTSSRLTGLDAVDVSRTGTSVPGSLGVSAASDERMRPRVCRRGEEGGTADVTPPRRIGN